MRVIEYLLKAVRSAAVYNSDVQVGPACILWPDQESQWQSDIPRLQTELPELLILGDYAPEKRTGPAIWLRCAVAGKTHELILPDGCTPILYLPGVSRQDLRAVESCPDRLKPLAELQYRGVIWSQINSKDWTILAFLKSDQGGLGLSVAQDNDAKNAMQLALYRLLDEEVELLRGKRLDKDYFNTLLTGGDPVRDLLQWLDQGEAFRESRGEQEWTAFVEVSKSQMAFNPQSEGILMGASKLASREGPWGAIWERFCEAPKRYSNIPAQIRKCQTPVFDLFSDLDSAGGWPQWNEEQERSLQQDLLALGSLATHEARKRIRELEMRHGPRRQGVWAELGEAPLAQAMEHLAVMSEITSSGLAAGSSDDLATAYCSGGWRADDAVIKALAVVEKPLDCNAVSAAIRSVYLPWAEDSARYLQKVVDGATYPGGTIDDSTPALRKEGECILFVDGLRFDSAKRLGEMLQAKGCEIAERTTWTALPSVTPTGKPSVSPVRNKIRGRDANDDFEPCVAGSEQSLKGGYRLKKLLKDEGWTVLDQHDNGNGNGNAWCESGDIDHEGHNRGWKLSRHIEVLIREIRDRIAALLDAGWDSVRVVTDHGWLLLPGGLPKVELASGLTDTKWGRCASLKVGASTNARLFPWFWNPNQHFVLADGISCFRKGEEYAHGGLSLQECLTLELTVTKGVAAKPHSIEFTDIVWKGLRCTVSVDGDFSGLSLDVRTQPGEAISSIVVAPKPLKANGTASVVVENEELEDHSATIILVDEKGKLIAQVGTVVGGGNE
jgi:hypothetical protein